MEKAIEIKRRAQRCVQNGDLDGALREYEKLVETPESDPYNFVLLADLLYKKGEQGRASERYLNAVVSYEKASLYKNAIAVCKKMMRLSLSQTLVLKHLAELHSLDGLTSEASIYYAQYAELMVRSNSPREAAVALRKAFDNGKDNVRMLEQYAEALVVDGQDAAAAAAWREASGYWHTRGQKSDARRCEDRAHQLDPSSTTARSAPGSDPAEAMPTLSLEPATLTPAPAAFVTAPGPVAAALGALDLDQTSLAAPPVRLDAAKDLRIERETGTFTPGTDVASVPGLTRPFGDSPAPPAAQSGIFERSPLFAAPAGPVKLIATPPVPESPSASVPSASDGVADTSVSSDDESEFVVEAAGVYDIGADEAPAYEDALHEAEVAVPSNIRPLPTPETHAEFPTPSTLAYRPEGLLEGVSLVENLLQRAQEEFRAGRREQASDALVEAAQTYETLGRFDSAATIFRSLGRGAQATIEVMTLWLANCEKRGDRTEGSQVATELGDRELNNGSENEARRWFEHATAIDANNETARRRLLRMNGVLPDNVLPMPVPPGATPTPEVGRVEVALGRGQAVTFDISSLLQEFQRGVESQLEGDSQGHYDLGMAYREMGLHDQAVTSFRIAEREPRLFVRAHEMIGRCLADAGVHDEAALEFEAALNTGALDSAGDAELRFQLALSLAALGDLAGAVKHLETAEAHNPGRPDVAERLALWRSGSRKAA